MSYKVTFRIRLGAEMTRLREKKHWSQSILAEEADVSTSTVQNLEYGWSRISLENFIKVCRALEASVTDVLIKTGYEDVGE